MFKKKKKKKKTVTCFLWEVYFFWDWTQPLSLSIFPIQTKAERKEKRGGGGGGATSVGSRLTSELVPTLTFQGSLTLGQMGLLKFVVMSSHKSLAAYPPTKR